MYRSWPVRSGLFVVDIVLLELIFYGTYIARFRSGLFTNPVSFTVPEQLIPSLVVTSYWVLLFAWFGLYRFDPLQSRSELALSALKATAVGLLIGFILTFDPNQPLPQSRIILASYGIAIYLIVAGDRILLSTVLRALRVRGIGTSPTLLVGDGEQARSLLRHVSQHRELGFKVGGYLGRHFDAAAHATPCFGGYSRLRKCLRSKHFTTLLLSVEPSETQQLQRLVKLLRGFSVRSFVRADQYPVLVGEVRPARLHGHPLLEIRPELLSPSERILKRVTDLAVSLALLVLILPIGVLLVMLIPLDSRGPIFYSQRRVGLNGREFTLYKFRSMVYNAEAMTGAVLAVEQDPRVTRIGRFLRAMRLDELPQLFNVLLGQMSLVGPRPERREFVERFAREIPLYERRLNVKPGITGWSQVHLKYDSRADQIPAKLKYDFFYIEHMSLPLDMKILFMTLFVILRGEGL